MIADKIYEILRSRTPHILNGRHFRPASVLVPIQERADGDYLVLTQRAERLNSHSGQVAFPGGGVDPGDRSAVETALRESREEIGIDPGDVRILGELDQIRAAANYAVTPIVGVIPFPYAFRLNASETAAVFSVPISALLDQSIITIDQRFGPEWGPIYHFQYRQWDIWGATARIIAQLLELVYDFRTDKPMGP